MRKKWVHINLFNSFRKKKNTCTKKWVRKKEKMRKNNGLTVLPSQTVTVADSNMIHVTVVEGNLIHVTLLDSNMNQVTVDNGRFSAIVPKNEKNLKESFYRSLNPVTAMRPEIFWSHRRSLSKNARARD